MDKEWERDKDTRRVAFDKIVDYVQGNYRKNMNNRDYEYLVQIYDFDFEDIKNAVEYCKSKNTDSLVYLLKALKEGYAKKQICPSWMDKELKKEPLSDKELLEVKELYKEFYD